jgi:hypothetical protein
LPLRGRDKRQESQGVEDASSAGHDGLQELRAAM